MGCSATAAPGILSYTDEEVGLSRNAMEKRGYGLSITPHGTNAKDLEYFVDLFGMSPVEALLCATRDGGAAAGDVRVLQDHSRITAVIKGGVIHRGLVDPAPCVHPPEAGLD